MVTLLNNFIFLIEKHVIQSLYYDITICFCYCRATKPWQIFGREITKDYLYTDDAPYMSDLIDTLGTIAIANTSMFVGGSQVKLDFTLADGNRAIVKPMR